MVEVTQHLSHQEMGRGRPSPKLLREERASGTIAIPVEGCLLVGRSRRCDVRMMHTSVSRMHCRIQHQDGGFQVEDLNSLTGTYLNEERIFGSKTLNDGDILRLGPFQFEVATQSDFEDCDWEIRSGD